VPESFVHGIGAARRWRGILSGVLDYDASRIRVKRSEFGVEMIKLDWMKRKIMKIARLIPQMRLRHFQLSLCGGVRDRGDSGL
jgi:hypothetical protein